MLDSANQPNSVSSVISMPATPQPAPARPRPPVANKGVSAPSPACANSSNITAAADVAAASEARTAATAAASVTVPLSPLAVHAAPTPVVPGGQAQGTPGSTAVIRTYPSLRLARAGLPAGLRLVDLDFLRQTVTGPPQKPIFVEKPAQKRHRGAGGRGGKATP